MRERKQRRFADSLERPRKDDASNRYLLSNALVQLQAHYLHCGEAASEKCLSAATFVRQRHERRVYSTRPIACGAARSKYESLLASRTCTTAVIRAPTDHIGPPRDMYSRLPSLEGGPSCRGVETHASSSRMSHAFSTTRPAGMRFPVPA